ncbi:uncharacterized protein LOC144704287 [Wolffia australiana]
MSTIMLDEAIAKSVKMETDPEAEFASCDCCGLSEECTPGYIKRVRERYDGRLLCGLCAEAVKDEISRSGHRVIDTGEAIKRHIAFCRSFRRAPAPAAAGAGDNLITAVRQLLRRGLDSPRAVGSASSTPRRRINGDADSPRSAFRPAAFFSADRLRMQI